MRSEEPKMGRAVKAIGNECYYTPNACIPLYTSIAGQAIALITAQTWLQNPVACIQKYTTAPIYARNNTKSIAPPVVFILFMRSAIRMSSERNSNDLARSRSSVPHICVWTKKIKRPCERFILEKMDSYGLLVDLSNHACTYRATTFADCKAQSLLHCNRS